MRGGVWCLIWKPRVQYHQVRQLVLGKARPYKVNAEGQVEEAGITLFDTWGGPAQVRVEDMCGNVGIAVVTAWVDSGLLSAFIAESVIHSANSSVFLGCSCILQCTLISLILSAHTRISRKR